MSALPRRTRLAQVTGSLVVAALIVAGVVTYVGARLPAVQARSPEAAEAQEDAQDAERDRARDAERDRDRDRDDR